MTGGAAVLNRCFERRLSIRLELHNSRSTRISVLVGLLATALVAATAIPALGSGTWSTTGSMNVARISHTATLLADGEVLGTSRLG